MSEMHRGVQDQLAQLRALQAAAAQERMGQRFPLQKPSGRESPEQLSSELCRMPLPVRCAELRTR